MIAKNQREHRRRTIFEGLHSRVATDTVQAAHALVGGVTGVDFGEFDGGARGSKRVAGGEPSRFHVLAVTTPAQSITTAPLQQSAHVYQGA